MSVLNIRSVLLAAVIVPLAIADAPRAVGHETAAAALDVRVAAHAAPATRLASGPIYNWRRQRRKPPVSITV